MTKQSLMLIILVCTIFFLSAWAPGPSAAETRVFSLTAKKYTFTPETIEVNKGDVITFEILAVDTKHGIGIKEYNLDQVLPKGEIITFQFVADKKGRFKIECTKLCGWGHPWMEATLVVR